MVTIEQKLSLFSKLLQQDIKNEISEKISAMEQEFEEKAKENKEKVDEQARLIVERSIKKAEIKKTEMISKAKMQTKKQLMITKEHCIIQCTSKLQDKMRAFTKSDQYSLYLVRKAGELTGLVGVEEDIVIYMTKQDTPYKESVLATLKAIGVPIEHTKVEEHDESMIGGLIVQVPSENIRMDLSIANLIEEQYNKVIEYVFKAIEQAGEEGE